MFRSLLSLCVQTKIIRAKEKHNNIINNNNAPVSALVIVRECVSARKEAKRSLSSLSLSFLSPSFHLFEYHSPKLLVSKFVAVARGNVAVVSVDVGVAAYNKRQQCAAPHCSTRLAAKYIKE